MDERLQVAVEMTREILDGLSKDLDGLTSEEADWRPLPEGNSIAVIVRHLAIESQWHRACLEQGDPMPHETTDDLQQQIDAVPLAFESNLKAFQEAFGGFLETLRNMTLVGLRERSGAAYRAWPSVSAHLLGYHQAMHVSMHWGQIRTIRNLYQKTRGEPARFFPDNPTYPKGRAG
jgi:hypothetical protein